eukprot:gene6210-27698_t
MKDSSAARKSEKAQKPVVEGLGKVMDKLEQGKPAGRKRKPEKEKPPPEPDAGFDADIDVDLEPEAAAAAAAASSSAGGSSGGREVSPIALKEVQGTPGKSAVLLKYPGGKVFLGTVPVTLTETKLSLHKPSGSMTFDVTRGLLELLTKSAQLIVPDRVSRADIKTYREVLEFAELKRSMAKERRVGAQSPRSSATSSAASAASSPAPAAAAAAAPSTDALWSRLRGMVQKLKSKKFTAADVSGAASLVEQLKARKELSGEELTKLKELIRKAPTEQNVFTFRSQDLNGHYLPARALLVFKFRIVHDDPINTPFTHKETATVVNHAAAIFSRAIYKINGLILEEITQHLEHRANIDAITQYSSDYVRSIGAHMMIFKDNSVAGDPPQGEINDLGDEYIVLAEAEGEEINLPNLSAGGADELRDKLTKVPVKAGGNSAFMKRHALTKNSQVVHAVVPLNTIFGFLADHEKVITGATHEWTFYVNSRNVMLHAAPGIEPKLAWFGTACEIWFPKIQPHLNTLIKLNKMLLSGVKRDIEFTSPYVHTSEYPDPGGAFEGNWRITSCCSRPLEMYVMFQRADRQTDVHLDSLVYDHLNVRHIHCWLNASRIPQDDLTMDYAGNDFYYPFMNLLAASNLYDQAPALGFKDGSTMTPRDFKERYPIYHFRLANPANETFNSPHEITLSWGMDAPGHAFRVFAVVNSMKVVDSRVRASLWGRTAGLWRRSSPDQGSAGLNAQRAYSPGNNFRKKSSPVPYGGATARICVGA